MVFKIFFSLVLFFSIAHNQRKYGNDFLPGNEVLLNQKLELLANKRVGLITNSTGILSNGIFFLDALKEEPRRIAHPLSIESRRFSYRDRGFYSAQLERVFKFFEREQVHIVKFENFRDRKKEALDAIFDFLGVKRVRHVRDKDRNVVPYERAMGPEERRYLLEVFAAEIVKLEQILGQPLVIDNRPGAGGNVAAEAVAHAAPDGYTLFNGNNAILATNAALYKKINFDPEADFAPIGPIGLIGSQANILVVNPALPAKSMGELIALAKANPGKLNFASSGHGLAAHLAGELFKAEAKIDIVHVPYKG